MKIMITGATGFVGANLTRRLVEEGHSVSILTRQGSDRWRIADLLKDISLHEVDLRDAPAVERAVTQISPQVIYHLATYGGFAYQKDSAAIMETNFLGTVNLLKACEMAGFDCFVNTGSSSEYGIKQEPMKETDFLEPIGDYGVSKSAASLFCQSEAKEKKLPVVTFRLFSPYGPWEDPKRLIPYVIKSLLRNDPPRLSRPGSVRDFIFVNDIVDLYLQIMKKPLFGDILNVGAGQQHTIGEVVSLILEIIGHGPAPIWDAIGIRRPEPKVWTADINKIKEKLQWTPSTSMRSGLERTVEWFREHPDL